MKLYNWPSSPFGAKVWACILASNLQAEVTYIPTHPWAVGSNVDEYNPLHKIPVLCLETGQSIYDSAVICAYIDSISSVEIIPKQHKLKWKELTREALADGVMEAGVNQRYETSFRPQHLQSKDWLLRQQRKIEQGLAACEQEAADLILAPTIGSIACAIMLGYLNFRKPDLNWQVKYPNLACWYEKMSVNEYIKQALPNDNLALPEKLESIKI